MPFAHTVVEKREPPVESGPDGEPVLEEAHFLNLKVHAMTVEDMHSVIALSIARKQKWLIANHNLHSVYFSQRKQKGKEAGLTNFYRRAKWTHVDGMSIVLLARLFGNTIRRSHRIAYNHSLPHLLGLAERKGWRVFYLGSSEVVSSAGLAYFKGRYPDLIIETQHGYFSKEKMSAGNCDVLARIQEFKPNILFVGMGMPIQEEWIDQNYDALDANIILASGATLDYFVGALPIPPAWVGKMGLEWAYRLANEPRRLGYRYLIEPWFVLLAVIEHVFLHIRSRHR